MLNSIFMAIYQRKRGYFMNIIKNVFEFLSNILITLHIVPFDMIRDFPNEIRYSLGFAIFQLFSGIVLLLVALTVDIIIIGLICVIIYNISICIRTDEIKRHPVVGIVTSTKHEEEHTTYVFNGKFMSPIFHSEEYCVNVQYGNIPEVFYSKKLFEKYAKNDPISLILVERLDKNKHVIKQNLELPE